MHLRENADAFTLNFSRQESMATHTAIFDLRAQQVTSAGASDSTRADGEDDEISLLGLLILLAGRWRLILRVTAGFAVLSIVVSLLLPVSYTASVTLLPPPQNSTLSSQLAAQLGSLSGMMQMAGGSSSSLLKNPNDMYVAMLKSRTVENAMVSRFGLMQEYRKKYLSDARKAFERHADVDGSGKDGLIHIKVEDHDPNRAAALANGYVDQFRGLSEKLAITEAQQRRLFFEDQWKQANQNLADAEEALKETQQKTGLIEIDSQARALIESAAALRAQITFREVQIQGMRTYATGENAQLIEAEQELAGLRAQLAKLGGSGDNPDGIIVSKGQMTAAGMEYVRRLRDVKYYETIFDILARQFELAKLDEAREGAMIQIVDPAISPDKRSFPRRTLIVLCGSFLGLLLGILIAFASAAVRRMRKDPKTSAELDLLFGSIAGKRSPFAREAVL
jgi:uncharacterized protein involved in exopolysaccharide biosynthesis